MEIDNLKLYGYGIKGYILSMIEAAMRISNNTLPIEIIEKILQYGKELLEKPIVLLEGVEETLAALHGKYKLVVATKGDLLDQRRKLHNSGLGHYFHHIEVMSDKQEIDYSDLLRRLEIAPAEFFMIGNSLKSDILPVLAIGGHAVHIPFHTTWAHEKIDHEIVHKNFMTYEKISDVLNRL
jgi:putative hydrolase of the HAD superfamily